MMALLVVAVCEPGCDRCAAYFRFMEDAIAVGAHPEILRLLSKTLVDALHGRAGNSRWAALDAIVERILRDADPRPVRMGALHRLYDFLAENRDVGYGREPAVARAGETRKERARAWG